MKSQANTVQEYLNNLPEDRRTIIAAVRQVILENLPEGYQEDFQYGMIGYNVPLKLFPEGYLRNKTQPLPYVALAAQKNHLAIYLMNIYMNKETQEWFHQAYLASGKKYDMGKACLRFKKLQDLPLDLIGQAIARFPVKEFIDMYQQIHKK